MNPKFSQSFFWPRIEQNDFPPLMVFFKELTQALEVTNMEILSKKIEWVSTFDDCTIKINMAS